MPELKTEKFITKNPTQEEIKQIIKNVVKFEGTLENLLEKISKKPMPDLKNCPPEIQYEKIRNWLGADFSRILQGIGVESHIHLANISDEMFSLLATQMADRITREYKCEAPSEKALCDVIVNSYIKILSYSGKLKDRITDIPVPESKKETILYLGTLSKEIDRSTRQFIAALGFLRQIKSPPIEFNVKTKNAFISQNQQFNAISKQAQQDENVKPK